MKLTVTVAKKVPEEKRNMLRFFGAKVIEIDEDLCPDTEVENRAK